MVFGKPLRLRSVPASIGDEDVAEDRRCGDCGRFRCVCGGGGRGLWNRAS